MIYGRGAVDMKDMVAMILALARHLARTGQKPPRDLLFAFFADEENGAVWGAQWMVQNHPELFEGMTEAVSEVGGYSIKIGRASCRERVYGWGGDVGGRRKERRSKG